jgi:hypothetical protein
MYYKTIEFYFYKTNFPKVYMLYAIIISSLLILPNTMWMLCIYFCIFKGIITKRRSFVHAQYRHLYILYIYKIYIYIWSSYINWICYNKIRWNERWIVIKNNYTGEEIKIVDSWGPGTLTCRIWNNYSKFLYHQGMGYTAFSGNQNTTNTADT